MDDFNKTINIFKVTEKLKEIQQEIGLTDDEIILIAYSAAEHEHFDTLSVSSSQFLEWFTVNFEGENQQEIDFRNQLVELWQAAVGLSKIIVGHTADPSSKEWRKLRFLHFGEQLKEKLGAN